MQPAHQAATSALSSVSKQPMTAPNNDNATHSTQNTGLLAESLIRRVWLRMTEIYGHKWTSAFGDDAMTGAGETWAKALRDLPPNQLATGIEACAVASDPWPPTLPQFRALCLSIPDLPVVMPELPGIAQRRIAHAASGFVRHLIPRCAGCNFVPVGHFHFLEVFGWRAAQESNLHRST